MSTHTPDRSDLRLADLKQRRPQVSRLMNVKLPGSLVEAIDDLAERLGANKTEVVVALLDAGLAAKDQKRRR